MMFSSLLSSFTPFFSQAHSPSELSTEEFKPQTPVKIALVLGGGGARGIAHLGAIQELEKAGIRPDLIVGCSAGAIVGAFYADHPELIGTEEIFLKLKRGDLLDARLFGSRWGFVTGKKIRNFIEKHLTAKEFQELKIPLIVVVTDLETGESIGLCRGAISPAIQASCAIPGVFNPVVSGKRLFVDGGVVLPVPVEIAKKYGAQMVIAIDVSEQLSSSQPAHFLGVAKRSLEIAYHRYVSHSLEKADVVIRMDFCNVGMFSQSQTKKLYEEGRRQTALKIEEIKKKIESLSSLK